jgi:hypothetical protein
MVRPRSEDGVYDVCLCHGAAGVAHTYARIYQQDKDPCYRDIALEFYARSLGMRQPGTGIGGFSTLAWAPDRHTYWESDPSFLSGAVGVALALISAISPIPPTWDRLLLLSGPKD